ncbi:hypothetical protein VB711_02585 [Cronbergia sp. UHCC 0137]|uniref:hypothetical protein n=1 Tax=Cronbergia sp. UHCC 0137 TaxID=3110239 RepID=UPI002B1EE7D1|nr:hypothetical protein [Cronbergia sp. UHCC 0137]MEA5616730.1 hypothetical protein [Cronbergia sp. UHCC 0137]
MDRIYKQGLSIMHFSSIIRQIKINRWQLWLLLAMPLWLTTEAIAPQIVQAYTARVDLTIDRIPNENYETMLRRAEAVARAATQRSFDQDILVTEVSIIVSAQNYGAIAPVLSLEVSRPQWKSRPDPQRWVIYFKTARSLLLFDQQPSTTNAATPTTTPTNTLPNTVEDLLNSISAPSSDPSSVLKDLQRLQEQLEQPVRD